ncbi:GNAT family N-acetyltransferase [Streptomyces sp. NBC_00487]|uniref:GNAT family N-acetyltransferase n=1 Tax=unclassified Streptomyces TaxID=2593676 RepID=UPI002DD9D669|nr:MULTISPECIES: GNAT family N-acetyltransferase [unclassified Streptomyces]WRY95779.1 GNAT family N-acetyltransferase [Streptomyces sp. NBC_00481]
MVDEGAEEATVRKVAEAVTGTAPAYGSRAIAESSRVAPVPDGYRLRTWSRGGVTRVIVAAPDGSPAARGQIGPPGATAVVDRAETSPAHRRRGLGTLVMRNLTRAALARGAEAGVPGGTPDGRAPYGSPGWRVDAPLTSAKYLIRRRLGYLPQEFGVFRSYTVREFLSYAAWLREMPGGRIPEAVAGAAEAVGLQDRLGHRLRTLSGGMKQRVGIAQAIVNSPTLLLLDEPTAGLDPQQRSDFHSLVRRRGRTACVVVSTHLMEDVEGACDDVTVLSRGRVAFHGPLDALDAAGGYAAVVAA